MGIGQRIREYRIIRKMSQSELAYKAKTEPSSVSRWETEKGKPNAESLKNLSAALGVKVSDIVEGADNDISLHEDIASNNEPHEGLVKANIVIEREEGESKTRIILPYDVEAFGKVKEVLDWLAKGNHRKLKD